MRASWSLGPSTRRLWAVLALAIVFPTFVAALPAATSVAAGAAPSAANPRCTFHASGSASDEWGSCMQVTASMDAAPAVGQTATVHVTVRSQAARPAASVSLDVPSTVQLSASGPAALSTPVARFGQGSLRRATVRTDLAAGSVRHYSFEVRPSRAGPVNVHVGASSRQSAGAVDHAEDDLYFTAGTTAATSHLGAQPAPTHGTSSPVPAGVSLSPTPRVATTNRTLAPASGGGPTQDEPRGQAPGAPGGQGCITGGWFYVDNNNVTRPAVNETVQAWDHDTASSDDQLAIGVVGFNGRFQLCFSSDDGFLDNTQEVYLRYLTTNTRWRVRDTAANDTTYSFSSQTLDVCDGCDVEFGNRQPSNTAVMPALHTFDALNDLWVFVEGGSQNCFDRNDTTCRQMIANWTSTSTDGSAYHPDTNDIHFRANAPNSQYTLVHEGSHALMDDVYEDDMPPIPSCSPHDIPTASSTGCAWVEGFAEWLPAEVYNNPIYQYPDGTIANLEAPTWNTPSFANGDTVEGRIAGTLIDISDTTNENFWDFAGEGRSVFAGVYVTFLNNVSDTLNEFLTVDRVNQGFEFSDSLSRASAYQNTIDYQFRDPLVTRVERVRPTPVPAQNYGYSTSASFWSIVALRQPGDYDLRVYDNRDLSGLLTSSTFGSNTMDFVAVDSNRRSFGDYYAQVSPFGGSTGSYSVEYVQGNVTVPDGTHSIFFSSGDVANVEDSLLSAGVPTFFRVVPAAGQDLETFLMRSDANNAATFAQGRGAAVRSSNAGGAGVDESFSFTESASQWDGLVVTNRSGTAGTYTVYRDTTAPTGSVFINAGAPRTNIRDVTAFLSASDNETGAYQMRVAFDGVLDTEPWVPYATTRKGTLPTGDGTKTVAVQFRNNALMPSAVFKDTIVLDRRPNLVVTAISNPPSGIRRGKSFSVTDTTRNTGPNPTGKTTQTRYYLSVDKVKSGGDILLTGARSVPSLPVFTSNTGTRSVTVPTSAGTVQYFLIACSDATNVVSEFSETDNCRASATKVKVNP